MGNVPSNLSINESEDIWWSNGEKRLNVLPPKPENSNENASTFENFVEEFDRKREKRKMILEEKRKEIQDMRYELQILRKENERMRNTPFLQDSQYNKQIEFLQKQNQSLMKEITLFKEKEESMNILLDKNKELRISVSEMQDEIQKLNSCVLDFEQEKNDYRTHVIALKDVIKVSKELLLIRENELEGLKTKMKTIEAAFNEREASLMSNDLRKEYERQLANIRTLRELYEERSRTYGRETALLRSSLADKDKEIEENAQKMSDLQERIENLEKSNSDKYDSIKTLESSLGLAKAEGRQYQAELTVINQLFSHILLAFNNSPDLDLDKLLKQLEDNHDLLKDIVSNEISSEVSSALPKVLLDLVDKISSETDQIALEMDNSPDKKLSTISEGKESSTVALHNLNSPAEIAENLPKVWRILIELLSHQSADIPDHDNSEEEEENKCFKTIVTPKGPSLVLSVSKTFFRLKELIIEKKTLEKHMNNLKQLNSHLETRLQDQEKRFEIVSSELSKTWTFVGRLQKEHRLLHTQEQILRYELAQKRKLLKELKQELEYSREKWQEAREKNSKTEREWLILRKEFASRKNAIDIKDGNNSVESGYSDERGSSSDEEPGYETDISECNLKVDENCEDERNEDIIEKKPVENTIMINDQPGDDSTSNQGIQTLETTELRDSTRESCSILNVIQNELTVISAELPTDISNTTDSQSVPNEPRENQEERSHLCSTSKTLEERLAARDERLRNLEGQCRALVTQVANTSQRSEAICSKLEDLHEIYGERSTNVSASSDAIDSNIEEVQEETNDGADDSS
ncbi:hypothetical protein HHI36_019705 [Cryptolaemus montrouzieri]|uniref:Uncharacterized protein n=1 Tax=Cryptolaemus montrouzieri TaxID=559131 RepID=A0ABD2N8M4_9CUCU